MTWIRSSRPTADGPDGSDLWHLAKRHEVRGNVTGKLLRVYYVAACRGRQLGGAWGQDEEETRPSNVCVRCAKIAAREGAT